MEPTDDDRGLANERTALGWRRTGLTAAGLTGVVARTRVDRLDALGIVALTLAVSVVVAILSVTLRRAEAVPDGRGSAVLALLISAMAALQAVAILVV